MRILFAFCFVFSAMAMASDVPTHADPKMAEMMKKFEEYAKPGDAHKRLSQAVGKWSYTSKWWHSASAPAETSKGVSQFRMILGGRFLEHSSKGKAMGAPFEGLGLTGFNNVTGKYETLWLDSMGTGMTVGSGDFDAKTNILSDSGEMTCPMSSDKKKSFRSEWTLTDKNNMTLVMYGPDMETGKEYKQGELVFKRMK